MSTPTSRSQICLHRLTMVQDGDDVMVGRPDIGSYAVFPTQGAHALRLLDQGRSLAEVAEWYELTTGESLDVEDFLDVIEELQFVLGEGEKLQPSPPVRWQRIGRWTFSGPAWLIYSTCVVAAIVAMVRVPVLRPSYRSLFFTDSISVIPVALLVLGMPCIVIHEFFHALAGRRLGLPSTFGIGRRLYFLVAETRLDALLSVPRRKRYLPFLAGIVADVVMASFLTLLAVLLRTMGASQWAWGICVALAFECLLRLLWQFQFYLQTDLYYVASTALGCTDLQNACRFLIRNQIRRLRGRQPLSPEDDWSDHDLRVARWYAPVVVGGYGFALGSLAWVGIPTMVRFFSTVLDRITRTGVSLGERIDALIFLLMATAQLGLLMYLMLGDWRRRRIYNRSAL